MSGDVLLRVLEMACQWASNKAREIGEPWHFGVKQVDVTRHEWHRNVNAKVELVGVLTETALKSMEVGPKPEPSGRAMAVLEQANKPVRARVSSELQGDWSRPLVDGMMEGLREKQDATMSTFLRDEPAQTRAGVRALLEKYEKGIINAASLASLSDPGQTAQTALHAAQNVKGADPVADLLRKVGAQRERVERGLKDMEKEMQKLKEERERLKAADPEEQLRRRLRLKVRAQYANEERMLREFQSFLWENYSCLLPENQKPNAVPDFLQKIEDDDDAYSGET